MKKKTKLVALISSFCLVLALGIVGVLAVTDLTFNMGGSVTFDAEGVNAIVYTAELDGMTMTETGKMQQFEMNTDLAEPTEGIDTWGGGLHFQIGSTGTGTVSFDVKNTTEVETELLGVEITITGSTEALSITSNGNTEIEKGATHTVVITFAVKSTEINASVEDFDIGVRLFIASGAELDPSNAYQGMSFALQDGTPNTASVTAYNGSAKKLEIPSRVIANSKIYQVTSIGNSAFSNKTTLERVTLPNTITSIGNNAFASCSKLVRVELPESIETMGTSVFKDTALQEIDVPGIQTISAEMLSGSRVTEFVIPQSVTSLQANCFNGADWLVVAVIDSPTIAGLSSTDSGLQYIPTLYVKSTLSVGTLISQTYSEIGEVSSGRYAGYTEYGLADSVEALEGKYEFTFDGDTAELVLINNEEDKLVKIPGYVISDGKVYKVTSIACADACTLREYANIVFPATIKEIKDRAFSGNLGGGYVTFAEGIERIGDYAFGTSWEIGILVLPRSLQYVGIEAFDIYSETTIKGDTTFMGTWHPSTGGTEYIEGNVIVDNPYKNVEVEPGDDPPMVELYLHCVYINSGSLTIMEGVNFSVYDAIYVNKDIDATLDKSTWGTITKDTSYTSDEYVRYTVA